VTEPTEIRFDGWLLRTDTGELVRDGRQQRLTQQPLRILLELLRKPGEVVTRERLVEILWPKGVVDFDNGLNVAVRKLRMTLGDESETPRYIETLPRMGYRFIGRFEVADGGQRAPAALTAAAPGPEPPRAARPKFRRTHWLFAGGIVGGAVLASSWLMQAIPDASTPDESTLDTPASPAASQATAPMVARRTTSVRAYEHYLQGIFHRSRRDADSTQQAIAEFKAAIAEDPEYAEAWAGLGDTYIGAAIAHTIPASKAFEESLAAARRSVELDPGLAETHSALGQVYMFYRRDYAAAEAEYALAKAANERYARLWHQIGMLRAFQGRADEAIAAIRRARELEPMTLLYNANYGLVLYHARRYDEAIEHVRGLLVVQPQLTQARSLLIRALVATGRTAEAMAELPKLTLPNSNVSDAALVYAHAGDRKKALAEIARIEKLGAQGFGVGYDLSIAHAALGDFAKACQALELAWNDSSPFLGWMTLDPRMDPIRKEPCYAEMQRRVLRQ
jgi:DNA-binding winged helix-turn-helix (wHTH) protein/tetratricopeptide (TPR) repeat protein